MSFWKKIFHYKGHTEGDSYLGLVFIFCSIYLIIKGVLYIKNNRKIHLRSVFESDIFLLLSLIPIMFFAMGFHNDILNLIKPNLINKHFSQFRSLARLSWVFYYVLTPFLAYKVYVIINKYNKYKSILLIITIALLTNDAISKINTLKKGINIYKTNYNEHVNSKIVENDFQAILCLPYYHIGSEKLTLENEITFNSSIQISLNTGFPIINTMLSRTSISQTYKQLKLLSNNTENSVLSDLNSKPLLVIASLDQELSYYENEIINKASLLYSEGKLSFYKLEPNSLKKENIKLNKPLETKKGPFKSQNYLKKEKITVNINHSNFYINEYWIYHNFNNKIYGFPQIKINENNYKPLNSYDFEMIDNYIVFKIKQEPKNDKSIINFEGLGIDVDRIELYKNPLD